MVKMQIFFHPDPICDNKLLGCLLQNKFFALNQKGFGGVWRVLGYGVLQIFCKKCKTMVCFPKGHRHLIDPTKLIAGTKVVYPEQPLEEIFGEVIASPKERLMQTENNQANLIFWQKISSTS